MRPLLQFAFLSAVLPMAISGSAQSGVQKDAVEQQTRSFLDAYARGDATSVLRSVDAETVVYGSDVGEVFRGRAAIRAMLEEDHRLWRGNPAIGEMMNASEAMNGDLRTIFFNATFSLAGSPSLPVRYCMVWRHTARGWLLVQSSNAVVTTGQSAAALLKR